MNADKIYKEIVKCARKLDQALSKPKLDLDGFPDIDSVLYYASYALDDLNNIKKEVDTYVKEATNVATWGKDY